MKFFTTLIAFASAGLVAGKKRGCAKAKEGCENDCKPFKGVVSEAIRLQVTYNHFVSSSFHFASLSAESDT